jgi:hypothetical protein
MLIEAGTRIDSVDGSLAAMWHRRISLRDQPAIDAHGRLSHDFF